MKEVGNVIVNFVNFCFKFLQELSIVWEAISNTRKSVFFYFQTPWSWLKKLGCASFFQPTSPCLEIGGNTLPHVWSYYYFSNSLMIHEGKTKKVQKCDLINYYYYKTLVNFCFEFLQESLMVWEPISKTWERVVFHATARYFKVG